MFGLNVKLSAAFPSCNLHTAGRKRCTNGIWVVTLTIKCFTYNPVFFLFSVDNLFSFYYLHIITKVLKFSSVDSLHASAFLFARCINKVEDIGSV